MKIGILCATEAELAPFLPHLQEEKCAKKALLTIREGRLCGLPAVLAFSGVCKVNAAVCAQTLIDGFGATCVINAGTAGGMDSRVGLFDTVVAEETRYHDVEKGILTDYHPYLPEPVFRADEMLLACAKAAAAVLAPEYRVCFGRIVTGEAFISDEGREAINRAFSPLAVDMESAAVAHVCHLNAVPFLSVRTVTDTEQEAGEDVFARNCAQAAEISCRLTMALLERISEGKTDI